MPIENQLPPLSEWLPSALSTWAVVAVLLILVGLVAGYLVAAVRRGPWEALRGTLGVVATAIADLTGISPRRVIALSRLAIKESIRRKVVVGFAVFIFVLLLAGWFLDPASRDPARLYISFVLTTSSYLVLLLALFLSGFSLPQDIAKRTLHTVVTKPVRASEIVLGRMIGFSLVGTVLIGAMCLLSYLFVVRGLAHSHALPAERLRPATDTAAGFMTGETERARGHRHAVRVDAKGQGQVETEQAHSHALVAEPGGEGAATRYRLGPPEGDLLARVPVYGRLQFRDSDGFDKPQGISVGDEWTFRSYIEGGTPAAAIWTFENVDASHYPDGLPVEMTIGVFRSHKGKIDRTVLGSLALRNPKTGLTIETEIFESKEFEPQQFLVPRTISDYSEKSITARQKYYRGDKVVSPPADEQAQLASLLDKAQFDLFEDLVSEGRVEVWLRCLEPAQYFGAGPTDLYFRARDASVELNFVKGYFGIWLQMVLVVGIGVMFSTFLNGSVATVATLAALVMGLFREFMAKLATGETYGGGPVESFRRIVSQQNLLTPLEPGLATDVTKMADQAAQFFMRLATMVLPPFADFNFAGYVASGYDISWETVAIRTLTVVGFLVPLFVAGYLFLRNREVAR